MTIQRSTELEAIAKRWVSSLIRQDRDALRNLFSTTECLTYIGTDADELWSGKLVREAYPEHVGELPEFTLRCEKVDAYENGETGWASWFGTGHFISGDFTSAVRITFVFALEQGIWRIVQMHLSFPKPNVEVIGKEHSVFNEIISSVKSQNHNAITDGTTTIMFTDIVDSTALASAMGDHAWSETIKWHDDIVNDHIQKQKGTLVKSLGDGTMSTFNSARSALISAQNIRNSFKTIDRDPRLELRLGINTGDVVATNNDLFGSVVNKAARLASAASANEIVLADTTRAMVSGSNDFVFSDPIEVRLKGLDGNHVICKLQ